MRSLKALLYVYKRSLIDIKYYKDLLKVDIKFSFKYFFGLAILASVITTATVSIPMIPEVQGTLNEVFNQLEAIYPEDLVITTSDGEWGINQPEPYIVPTPDILKTLNTDSYSYEEEYYEYEAVFPDNLLIFDHEGTINNLKERNSLMLLNGINLMTLDTQGKIEAFPLDGLSDGEFTKAHYLEIMSVGRSYMVYLPYFLILFVLFGTFIYFFIVRIIYLWSVALGMLAIGYFRGLKLKLRTYYKLAMHSMTLPLTLEVLFLVIGVTVNVPSWFLAINLIFGIAVVYHLSDTKTPAEKRTKPQKKKKK